MAATHDERSLGDLFAELSRETGVLVRKEVELATAELTGKAKLAGADAATVAAGGALAAAGRWSAGATVHACRSLARALVSALIVAVYDGGRWARRARAGTFCAPLTPTRPSNHSRRPQTNRTPLTPPVGAAGVTIDDG